MKTQVLSPTPEALHQAAKLLLEGRLVALPTETVYGLGANGLDESAVRAIFTAKGRPADNPLILHVPDMAAAEPLCHLTEAARALFRAFSPGPLTLLLQKKDCIPPVVNAGLLSVAIRIPAHPVMRDVLRLAGVPIAAPSANLSGRPSPTAAAHVLHDFEGRIPLILDGGPCQVGLESTVVDMTAPVPTVLRPGGVTPDMLLTVLPELSVSDTVLRPLREGEKALSPGMMYRHYAPGGQLLLVRGRPENVRDCCLKNYRAALSQGKRVRILAFQEHLPFYEDAQAISIGSLNAPETVARSLFSVLRQMDEEQIDLALCEVLPPTGVGLAIMNRLSRAASFQVLDANQEETP